VELTREKKLDLRGETAVQIAQKSQPRTTGKRAYQEPKPGDHAKPRSATRRRQAAKQIASPNECLRRSK